MRLFLSYKQSNGRRIEVSCNHCVMQFTHRRHRLQPTLHWWRLSFFKAVFRDAVYA